MELTLTSKLYCHNINGRDFRIIETGLDHRYHYLFIGKRQENCFSYYTYALAQQEFTFYQEASLVLVFPAQDQRLLVVNHDGASRYLYLLTCDDLQFYLDLDQDDDYPFSDGVAEVMLYLWNEQQLRPVCKCSFPPGYPYRDQEYRITKIDGEYLIKTETPFHSSAVITPGYQKRFILDVNF